MYTDSDPKALLDIGIIVRDLILNIQKSKKSYSYMDYTKHRLDTAATSIFNRELDKARKYIGIASRYQKVISAEETLRDIINSEEGDTSIYYDSIGSSNTFREWRFPVCIDLDKIFFQRITDAELIKLGGCLICELAKSISDKEDNDLLNGDASDGCGNILGIKNRLLSNRLLLRAYNSPTIEDFKCLRDLVVAENPVWIFNPDYFKNLEQTLFTSDVKSYPNSNDNLLHTSDYKYLDYHKTNIRLFNYPVIFSDFMPEVPNNEVSVIFGDLSNCITVYNRKIDYYINLYDEKEQHFIFSCNRRTCAVMHDLGPKSYAGMLHIF